MKIVKEGKKAPDDNIKSPTKVGKEGKKAGKNAKEIKLQRN